MYQTLDSPFFTLEGIALFIMLAQIQSHVFFLFRYSQSHDRFEYPENDQSADGRKYPGCRDCHNLRPELSRIAEEKTVVARSVNRFGCK